MNRKHFWIALALSALACFAWVIYPRGGVSEQVGVKIAYQPIVFGLPVFIAEERGLFKSHNVKAEAEGFTSANDMISALVAGRAQIVPGAPLVPVLSLESKYPGRFRVFAHSKMTDSKPFDRIIVKMDSPIKSIEDLVNRKIAQIPGTTAMNALKAYFKNNNVELDKIEHIQLAPPAQLTALESGAVDALYAYEPNLTLALQSGKYRAITGSIYCSLLEPCPLVVAIIDRQFETDNPVVASGAIASIMEAHKLMRERPEDASLSLVAYTKIDPTLATKVSLQQMTLDGEMDISNLQRFVDILVEIGEIKDHIDAKKLIAK